MHTRIAYRSHSLIASQPVQAKIVICILQQSLAYVRVPAADKSQVLEGELSLPMAAITVWLNQNFLRKN